MRKKFYTTGIFCSWSCMKGYALDKYGINKGGIIFQNISLMRLKSVNKLGPITRAPNRYCLKCFGGTLDIDEFRKVGADNYPHLQMPDSVYIMPQVVHRQSLEPQRVSTSRDIKNKMDEINNSQATSETLKLKRHKPLVREGNNLESMLGIKRTSRK